METFLWVPENQPPESEGHPTEDSGGPRSGRDLRKMGTMNHSFTSNKSRHTVRAGGGQAMVKGEWEELQTRASPATAAGAQ